MNDIIDFLPLYPEIKNIEDINNKKEFYDYKLDAYEEIPLAGDLFKHQIIISRFLSSNTLYDELLLFHYMGTGKTCTSIACVEQIRKEKESNINGALIIVSSDDQIEMFKKEIIEKCTYKVYENKLDETFRNYYKFRTFGGIVKECKNNIDDIAELYSNHIIIIDEIQKLRSNNDKYKIFDELLHKVKNRKILLMSGTPMTDSFEEIIDIMNLILPKRIAKEQFISKYFVIDPVTINDDIISYNIKNKESAKNIKQLFKGRISYLKSNQSVIKKEFIGKILKPLKHFIVYPVEMSKYQFKGYAKKLIEDKKEDKSGAGLKPAASKAILLYFSDKEPIIIKKKNKYVLNNNFLNILTDNGKMKLKGIDDEDDKKKYMIKKLKIYSCKYANLIKKLLKNKKDNKCSFVYSEYVYTDCGNIFLSLLLQVFGFLEAKVKDNNTEKKTRYALFTSNNIKDKRKILENFNSYENTYGEYISVIIGSKIISTGNSFFHIQSEYILTPDWNYSTIEQAIARGLRADSHQLLLIRNEVEQLKKEYTEIEMKKLCEEDYIDINDKICLICKISLININLEDHYNEKHSIYERIVVSNKYLKSAPKPIFSVYQYVSTFQENIENIDLVKYKKCEIKDKNNKLLEYIIKTSSFDCLLNINRNKIFSSIDRDC